jgi:hypothetical protein
MGPIHSASTNYNPASSTQAEKIENNTLDYIRNMIGQFGHHMDSHEEKNDDVIIKLRSMAHQFIYSSAEASDREKLSREFNQDVAFCMLEKLFSEKGGEFMLEYPAKILKKGSAALMNLDDHIHNGVFNLKKFLDEAVIQMNKRAPIAQACDPSEKNAPHLKVEGAYDDFNLLLWLNDAGTLNCSEHPNQLEIKDQYQCRKLKAQLGL